MSSGEETAGASAIPNAAITLANIIAVPTAIRVIVTGSTIVNGKKLKIKWIQMQLYYKRNVRNAHMVVYIYINNERNAEYSMVMKTKKKVN